MKYAEIDRPSRAVFQSPPVWGAWVEIKPFTSWAVSVRSPPVWGAWVEIPRKTEETVLPSVAPRVGGVG